MTAPAELVIEVTADDIRLGKPGSVCQCPVAIAALRALGGEWPGFLKVEEDHPGTLQISLYGEPDLGDPYAVYPLPENAMAWVGRFDGVIPGGVAPFTFTAHLEATP